MTREAIATLYGHCYALVIPEGSISPKSITENFDTGEFARYAYEKYIYDILMESKPFKEFDDFYKCLDACIDGRCDRERLKSFSFGRVSDIFDKYAEIREKMTQLTETVQKEPIENRVVVDFDEMEGDVVCYLEVQYQLELQRLSNLKDKIIAECLDVIYSLDSLSDQELERRQVDLLVLLEDLRDDSMVRPDNLLANALSECGKSQSNVIDSLVMDKILSSHE